jgi:hypothetical protein
MKRGRLLCKGATAVFLSRIKRIERLHGFNTNAKTDASLVSELFRGYKFGKSCIRSLQSAKSV